MTNSYLTNSIYIYIYTFNQKFTKSFKMLKIQLTVTFICCYSILILQKPYLYLKYLYTSIFTLFQDRVTNSKSRKQKKNKQTK